MRAPPGCLVALWTWVREASGRFVQPGPAASGARGALLRGGDSALLHEGRTALRLGAWAPSKRSIEQIIYKLEVVLRDVAAL